MTWLVIAVCAIGLWIAAGTPWPRLKPQRGPERGPPERDRRDGRRSPTRDDHDVIDVVATGIALAEPTENQRTHRPRVDDPDLADRLREGRRSVEAPAGEPGSSLHDDDGPGVWGDDSGWFGD